MRTLHKNLDISRGKKTLISPQSPMYNNTFLKKNKSYQMCGYNRCSQSHIPAAGRAVSCFLTSVPMNGELRLCQAVDLAGWRRLRGPAHSGSHEPSSCRVLPASPQDSLLEQRSKPEAFIQEPGSDSQPLVIGRTSKNVRNCVEAVCTWTLETAYA